MAILSKNVNASASGVGDTGGYPVMSRCSTGVYACGTKCYLSAHFTAPEDTDGTDVSLECSVEVDTAVLPTFSIFEICGSVNVEPPVVTKLGVPPVNGGCGDSAAVDDPAVVSELGYSVGVVADAIDFELSFEISLSRDVFNTSTMLYALGRPYSVVMSNNAADTVVENSCYS